MTDGNRILGEGAFGPEPARDEALGALLRETEGMVPVADVDWNAFARRVSAHIATQATSSWWTYAARWERRVVPIALVAGLAAAVALFQTEVNPAQSEFVSASSVSTSIVSGAPFEDAAVQFAHSVTSVGDISTGIPE